MILYHGSTVDITEIELAMSKPNKDFGRGFYLSADKLQAQRLAEYKAFQIGGEPIINTYDFDERLLNDGTLKTKEFDLYGWISLMSQLIIINRALYVNKQQEGKICAIT